MLKGVLRGEDAQQAARLGIRGVIVSNHGGRQLDHAPSSISVLPAVVDAAGSEIEVYMDGGIRRGVDIVKALSAGDWDLALLDIRMGPINGIQLLEEIKGRKPRIKAIMMTAYPTIETRTQAFEKGASAYLAKPVDLKELVETMHSLLPH